MDIFCLFAPMKPLFSNFLQQLEQNDGSNPKVLEPTSSVRLSSLLQQRPHTAWPILGRRSSFRSLDLLSFMGLNKISHQRKLKQPGPCPMDMGHGTLLHFLALWGKDILLSRQHEKTNSNVLPTTYYLLHPPH